MNEKLSGGRKIGRAKLDAQAMTIVFAYFGPHIRQGGESEPCPNVLGVRPIRLAHDVNNATVLGVTHL
jgi:hypothetical protein